MGKNAATGVGAGLISQLLGFGQLGQTAMNYGAQLLTLEFSREDESEADLVGMGVAARAGFDPAPVSRFGRRWVRPTRARHRSQLSTHPSARTRIADIRPTCPR